MKSISELKKIISDNISAMSVKGLEKREYNSMSRENKKMKSIIMYLESNPSEDFIISEIARISKLIEAKESQFSYWSKNVCPQEIDVKVRKSLFNRELGINNLKKNLETLMYIAG